MHTNTKILAQEFAYLEPQTLDEALSLLDKHKPHIKVLAGGTDVLAKMKRGEFSCDYLLYVNSLDELNFIDTATGLKIGAATVLSALEKSDLIKSKYRALYDAVKSMAAIAIRNMATIGGNLCNAAPAADAVPPLLVFEATLKLASVNGMRSVPVAQFITGPEETILEPGELLTAIEIPALGSNVTSTFIKLGRVSVDMARINMAVALDYDSSSQKIGEARVALGAVGRKAFRCPAVEDLLAGQIADNGLAEQFAGALSVEIEKSIPGRYSLPYKRQAVSKLAYQAFEQLFST